MCHSDCLVKVCGFHGHLELLGQVGVSHSSPCMKVQVCPERTCWPALPSKLLRVSAQKWLESLRKALRYELFKGYQLVLSCSEAERALNQRVQSSGFDWLH